MAGWNDDDKTDHGMGQGGGSPFGQPPAQPHPPGPGDDRTVIGGALSPQGQPRGPQGGGHHGLGQPPAAPAYPAPGQAGGYGAPQGGAWPQAGAPAGQSSGGTWVGAPGSAAGYQPGGTGYQPPAYQPPPYQPGGTGGQQPGGYPGQQPGGYPGQPAYQGGGGGAPATSSGSPFEQPSQIGRAPGQSDQGFFPQYHQPDSAPRRDAPRIPLHEALRVRDLGAASSSNPLLASAASLLILLGRLRTGLVELQVAPLMEHVTREIERFEHNARSAGVDPHEVLVAKYALSGTADDIVQNLPGADRGSWQQYSMVARFFHKRDSGVGFFQEVEKALQAPAQRYNLLELMLVCLSLGFEGQFRTAQGGAVQLARYRNAIYESLRRVRPRPDEDISAMWQPVAQGRRRFGAVPVPAILGVGALAVVGIFATLSTLINRDGSAAAAEMRALHRNAPVIQLDRDSMAPVFVAPESTQLQRIREAFASEIGEGSVQVEEKGDFIAIRVGNLQLFDSGSVEVKPGFAALSARISQVLNTESGPVTIEGHTDSVPLSGRGRFKDNYQLSQARAEAVGTVLAPQLGNPARITTVGRGEDEPVGDNATPEGQSANRRVEILLAREGTYDLTFAPDATSPADPGQATDTADTPTETETTP